jgi:hypothetical protein
LNKMYYRLLLLKTVRKPQGEWREEEASEGYDLVLTSPLLTYFTLILPSLKPSWQNNKAVGISFSS